VKAVLERAVEVRLYTGHPREEEVQEAVGALCLAYRDWWKDPGAFIYGTDVAGERARL
jgi:hypothetical protein